MPIWIKIEKITHYLLVNNNLISIFIKAADGKKI